MVKKLEVIKRVNINLKARVVIKKLSLFLLRNSWSYREGMQELSQKLREIVGSRDNAFISESTLVSIKDGEQWILYSGA